LIDLVLDIEPGPQSASHGDHGPHEVTWQSTTATESRFINNNHFKNKHKCEVMSEQTLTASTVVAITLPALLGWRQKEQAGKSSQVFLRWRRKVQAFLGFVYCAKFTSIVETCQTTSSANLTKSNVHFYSTF
jgi:hypothetical protein